MRQQCVNMRTYLRDLDGAEDKGTPELVQTPVLESVLLPQCEEHPVKDSREDEAGFEEKMPIRVQIDIASVFSPIK